MKFIIMVLITSCAPYLAFKRPGIAPPSSTGNHCTAYTEGNQQKGREVQVYTYPCSSERCNIELSFATDIKQSAFIGDSDGETCKYKGRCVKQHIAEVVKTCEPADEDNTIEFQWILPAYLKHKSTQQKKTSKREERWYTINEQMSGLRCAVSQQRSEHFLNIQGFLGVSRGV